jgi:hypothetical protein
MDPDRSTKLKRYLRDGRLDITGDYRPGLCRNYEQFGHKNTEFQNAAKAAVVPGHTPSTPLMSGYDFLDILDQGDFSNLYSY